MASVPSRSVAPCVRSIACAYARATPVSLNAGWVAGNCWTVVTCWTPCNGALGDTVRTWLPPPYHQQQRQQQLRMCTHRRTRANRRRRQQRRQQQHHRARSSGVRRPEGGGGEEERGGGGCQAVTKGLSEKTEAIRAESELAIVAPLDSFGALEAKRGARAVTGEKRFVRRQPACELQVGEEVETETSPSVVRLALFTPLVWKVANCWRSAAGRRRGAEINWYAHRTAELRSGASFLIPRSVRGTVARVQRLLSWTERNRWTEKERVRKPPGVLSLWGFDKDVFQRTGAGCEAEDRPQRYDVLLVLARGGKGRDEWPVQGLYGRSEFHWSRWWHLRTVCSPWENL